MRHPSSADVHAAVRWALAHDLPALLAYRHDAYLDRRTRWKADVAFVAHWQRTTGAAAPAREGGR